jgi:hypothetical protein
VQTKTCDCCGGVRFDHTIIQDTFAPGWAHFFGTDSLGQHRTQDFCPRCSAVIQLAIGELRKRFTLPAANPSSPEPSGVEDWTAKDGRKLLG